MPIEIGIWRVEQTPQAIVPSMLDAEMESRVKADEFMVQAAHGAVPITEQPDCDPEIKEALSDANLANYLVRVEWTHSVPLSQAVRERGFFGNQNSVCQPRASKWEYTVNRLKEVWNIS